MRNFCFIILFFFVFSSTGIAQTDTAPPRIYTTQRIPSDLSIEIDGLLDDAAWDQVEWASDFIENEPNENTEPHQQTRFKVLYDEKFIYFGVQSLDKSPDSIVSWLSRRDGFDGDRINVFIDSYFDKRTAFMFGVTAAGVKGDAIVSQNGEEFDDSWNPVWYTDTNIDAEGWTAEMKIPLSQLRFGKSKEQIWGLNIARRIFRLNERSLWDRIPAGAAGSVSEYGELHGLIDLVPQKQLEIQPFTVLKHETYPEEENNPFRDGQDSGINAGLDAKIGVTNDLTLDLTVNPDFGQVEADPAAIALDGFQIFFREQRPFFVENKNIFEFELNGQDNLFYSRRIGRNPQGFVVPEDGEFVDIPENTTILGAAKFSGKTRDGWSIGILESVTAKEFAEIDRNGDRREELIEPLTNYFVARLQKDLNDRNSFIGGMFTATNRDNKEELQYLRTSAYSGGLDFLHQWKNREYFVRGKTILSHVEGNAEAIEITQRELTHLFQRIDADHVEVDPTRTSLTGTGGSFEGGRQGGGNFTYSLQMSWSSPELEINDIGFLRRTDNIRQEFEINYRILQPVGELRSFRIGLEQSSAFDFEGNYNR
ncbi:MAG: DUF5916 domain-containing protein, partial [Flavobacteriaceae bacterium]|nr:DUF5916 domain-containing protein [Flavobacteriaceae bacterium]